MNNNSNLPEITVSPEALHRMQESIDFAPGTQYTSKADLQRDIADPRYRQAYFQSLVNDKLSRSPAVLNLAKDTYVPKPTGGNSGSISEMLGQGVTPESCTEEFRQAQPKPGGLSIIEMLNVPKER
jgi:hypothetical protein